MVFENHCGVYVWNVIKKKNEIQEEYLFIVYGWLHFFVIFFLERNFYFNFVTSVSKQYECVYDSKKKSIECKENKINADEDWILLFVFLFVYIVHIGYKKKNQICQNQVTKQKNLFLVLPILFSNPKMLLPQNKSMLVRASNNVFNLKKNTDSHILPSHHIMCYAYYMLRALGYMSFFSWVIWQGEKKQNWFCVWYFTALHIIPFFVCIFFTFFPMCLFLGEFRWTIHNDHRETCIKKNKFYKSFCFLFWKIEPYEIPWDVWCKFKLVTNYI